MKCPNCNVNLVMSERQGVEIDYCPECRGVWLDRGELDKIIERGAPAQMNAAPQQPAAAPHYQQPIRREESRDHRDYKQDEYRHDDHDRKPKKRESLLGDLFDF